jgi:dTDP-4-dehydrorhamnose 3,5-epimerase-like enzyme
MENTPEILRGGVAVDDRGTLSYLNVAPLANYVRMYLVENFDTKTIRAFHGHKIEEKAALVVAGSAVIAVAKMVGDGESFLDTPNRYVLSARNPQLLRIPAGYANGFRALEPDTKILFFSSTTIEQAKTDDYRYQWDLLGEEIWEVENR